MESKILEIYYDELSTIKIKGKHGVYEPQIIENPERLAKRIVKLFSIPDINPLYCSCSVSELQHINGKFLCSTCYKEYKMHNTKQNLQKGLCL